MTIRLELQVHSLFPAPRHQGMHMSVCVLREVGIQVSLTSLTPLTSLTSLTSLTLVSHFSHFSLTSVTLVSHFSHISHPPESLSLLSPLYRLSHSEFLTHRQRL